VAYFFERCYGAAGAIVPEMLMVGIYFFGYLMRCLFKFGYKNFSSISSASTWLPPMMVHKPLAVFVSSWHRY
jgi:hypothetical protein